MTLPQAMSATGFCDEEAQDRSLQMRNRRSDTYRSAVAAEKKTEVPPVVGLGSKDNQHITSPLTFKSDSMALTLGSTALTFSSGSTASSVSTVRKKGEKKYYWHKENSDDYEAEAAE